MSLKTRIELLVRLGEYILSENEQWSNAKLKAQRSNNWFIPEFVTKATENIAKNYLAEEALLRFASKYELNDQARNKTIGLVMAGNIPLVGFHDFLCTFLSGFNMMIKPSSKDEVLITHLVETIGRWDSNAVPGIRFAAMLKGCDGYIATGSNNSGRYFDYYFGKYPHIIRRNRTSVAVLTGAETQEELARLADDVHLFFGLGCRNITKIYVPESYDFVPLIEAFKKYNYLAEHQKYKNNLDYNLAIHLLNKDFYMSSGSLLVVENPSLFSPISQLNYEIYSDKAALASSLKESPDVQCIVGHGFLPFGDAQCPTLTDYADRIDTMAFLKTAL